MNNKNLNNKIFVKALGIDFGSSKTCIAAILDSSAPDRLKQPVIFPNGTRTLFQTFIAKDNNGKLHFFNNALALSPKNTCRVFNNLKEDMAKRVNLDYSEQYFKRLEEKLVSMFYNDYIAYDFSRLEHICFGHPAFYYPTSIREYTEQIQGLIKKTLGKNLPLERISAVPEPLLAAQAYNFANCHTKEYQSCIADGDNILVLDFGGHTLDIATLTVKTKKDGFEMLTNPGIGSIHDLLPMGKDITKSLCTAVYDLDKSPYDSAVDQAKCDFFSHPLDGKRGKEYTLCHLHPNPAIKKFTLCYDETGDYVDGNTLHIGLASGEANIQIETKFERYVNYIKDYIQNQSKSSNLKNLRHILFTGGTSRIEPMRRKIINGLAGVVDTEQLSVFVMDDPTSQPKKLSRADNGYELSLSSDNAVAVGAALIAGGLVDNKMSEKKDKNEEKKSTKKIPNDYAEVKASLDNMKKKFALAQKMVLDTRSQLAYAESIINKYPSARTEYLGKKGKNQ